MTENESGTEAAASSHGVHNNSRLNSLDIRYTTNETNGSSCVVSNAQ